MPRKRIKKECYVCFSNLINTNKCVLKCGHVMCYSCLKSMFNNNLKACGLCRAQIGAPLFVNEIKRVSALRKAKKKRKPKFACCDRKYDKILAIPWKCGHKYCICCYSKLCVSKFKPVPRNGGYGIEYTTPKCIKCNYELCDDLSVLNPITQSLLCRYTFKDDTREMYIFKLVCSLYLIHNIRNVHMPELMHTFVNNSSEHWLICLSNDIITGCRGLKCICGNHQYEKYCKDLGMGYE